MDFKFYIYYLYIIIVKKITWRRAWQPTPVFLPGESHEQRSLAGYSPWGHRVGYDLSTKPPEYKCANLQRRYIKKGLLFPSKEDLAHFQLRILG